MLEGLLNNNQPDQAPQPMAPVNSGMGQGAPNQQVSFDVNRNPQDMQMMTDAMMFAPMLQQMDPEQRKEKWPGMVQSLSQVNPKAAQLFDPSLPPSDKDLTALMSKMPNANEGNNQNPGQQASSHDEYIQDQVKRQLAGQPSQSEVEWNAQKAAEDQKKKEQQENPQKQLSSLSDEEFIRHATITAGNNAKSAISGAFGAVASGVGNALFPSANAADYSSPVPAEDPRLKNAPKDMMWIDPNDPSKGTTPILGTDKSKPFDTDKPHVATMLQLCKDNLTGIENNLFDGQGGVNRDKLRAIALGKPEVTPYGTTITGITDPHAARLNEQYSNCIQAIARSQNPGRPASPQTIKAVQDVYMPKSTDSTDTIYLKYLMMKNAANQGLSDLIPDMKSDPKNVAIKAQADMSQLQAVLYQQKEKYIQQALALPDNQKNGVTADDVSASWNQKMVSDPDFIMRIKKWYDADKSKTPDILH